MTSATLGRERLKPYQGQRRTTGMPPHGRHAEHPARPKQQRSRKQLIKANNSHAISAMRERPLLPTETLLERKIIFPTMGRYVNHNKQPVEYYRNLRTQLLTASREQNFRLMVTSLHNGVCSTNFTLNLASCFAFEPNRTSLIIDCDTNSDGFTEQLGIVNQYGITDFLTDTQITPQSIIHPTGIQRVRYVPPGSCFNNSAEVFGTVRCQALMDILKSRYADRFIFIQAPPLLESADAQILGAYADLVILVVPYGSSTEEEIMSAVRTLNRNKLYGVVMVDPE